MFDFQGLDPFWKRYNKVLFDKLALQKEQSLLLQVSSICVIYGWNSRLVEKGYYN